LKDEDFEWTDKHSQEAEEYVKTTLQDNLWSKYTSFFDLSTHDLQLKLQPMNYALEHAYVIPVITRDAVAKDSKLLDTYHDLDESIIHNESSYDEVKEQVESLIEKAGGSRTTFTLVVDMSVECREQFCVTEKESGTVVQGTKDEENTVLHLVRFEMVLTKLNTLGSWIISDWDDMLGGNVWHVKKDKDESSAIEDEEKATTTPAASEETSTDASDETAPLEEDPKNDDNSSKEKPSP
jgi:hypothetical protein